MKRILLILLLPALFFFSACQKRKCKEQQAAELQRQLEIFQKEVSNPNLTTRQIELIKSQFDKRQNEILAECN